MKSLLWIIGIFVLQAVVAFLAKKAQAAAALKAAEAAMGAAVPAANAGSDARSDARSKPGSRPNSRPAPNSSSKASSKSGPMSGPKSGPKASPKPAIKPGSIRPSAAPAVRGGDSAAAFLSRQHVADSVARVKAAELRASSGLPSVAPQSSSSRTWERSSVPSVVNLRDLANALRNPARVRQAIVMNEVLGRPRVDRPL
ncbi:MAG: hypothetical protein DWI09_05670 [Planctomycetota bacterium]|jgi:hypothetical protein|nr:MAG: hypothetical protein DWI09_05670 [Planctomycetota bacterium]